MSTSSLGNKNWFGQARKRRRGAKRNSRVKRQLRLEALERRELLTTFHEAPGVGWEGAGADFAYVDLNDNGIDDVIVMAYDDPAGANHFRYRIGYDVDSNGEPRRWSRYKQGPSVGHLGQGAGLAVTDLDGDSRKDVVFMAYDTGNPENQFRYVIGYDMTASGKVSSWSSMRKVRGVGWEGDGAGLAIGNLDTDPRPDGIFMAYDDGPTANTFRYRVGYNLNSAGRPQYVGDEIRVSGVGWEGAGAGIALANLDNDPRPDVVMMAYDDPPGANTFRLEVGYNLGSNGRAEWWTSYATVDGLGWRGDGAGIAVKDLDGDGYEEFVFMAYDDPAQANEFRFMVHQGETSVKVDDGQLWVNAGVRGGVTSVTTIGGSLLRVTYTKLNGIKTNHYVSLSLVDSIRINGSAAVDQIYNNTALESTIYGGRMSDTLYGGINRDRLFGGRGNDALYGGEGDDYLDGGSGHDVLGGGDGDDVLRGGSGNDRLYGSNGNDRLYAGTGRDRLYGGTGNDTLVSIDGDAVDILYGEGGTDSFWVDDETSGRDHALDNVRDSDSFERADNLHYVAAFANGVDKTLNGDEIADPMDWWYYRDFSDHVLFADEGPTELDIRQGNLGDCWLMAGLGAAADSNPNAIRQTVVELGDGTYAVELGSNYYRVDGDLPTWNATTSALAFAQFGEDGSIWVPIVEKAYAHFRDGLNTYGSIVGGWAGEVFVALGQTGLQTRILSNATQALTEIAVDLQTGKAVTVSTNADLPEGLALVGNHSYMVQEIHYETVDLGSGPVSIPVSITLRNPWGVDGWFSTDGNDDGDVTISGNELINWCQRVTSAWV